MNVRSERPPISIVIPLYNKESHIKSTLESILEQDMEEWEALVVDDGSNDCGPDIVKAFARRDSRIRLLSQNNQGVSAARNHGISSSQGDIVCFIDADDQWNPGHLSVIRNLSVKYPRAELYFDQGVFRKNGKLVSNRWFESNASEGYLASYCEEISRCPNLINSSNVAIKMSVFTRIDPWFIVGDAIGEDLELWLRLSRSLEIAFSSYIGSIYNRDVEDNARTRNGVHYPRGYFETINSLLQSNELTDRERASLYHVRDRKMIAYIFSLIISDKTDEARSKVFEWNPASSYSKYKPFLIAACYSPKALLYAVNSVRMRLL